LPFPAGLSTLRDSPRPTNKVLVLHGFLNYQRPCRSSKPILIERGMAPKRVCGKSLAVHGFEA
jgi:hypothetical protein